MISKSITKGVIAASILLLIYFVILSLVSSFDFAKNQFSSFWYFILSLAVGFGVQISLYTYLRDLVKNMVSKKVLAVSGTTSTVAMISCCTHYLANILPILGAVGIVTFVAQYQVEIFYVGLLLNLFGIAYIIRKIIQFKKHAKSNLAAC
ncbi:MAG: hypothetical protein A2126_00815 [Candidatus Woykebacteria bacterium GWB1_45_5]|uniref:Uncharacterized protein n=1 Tax=Candidatus Woykebacteria bacterium GWB1_45_5 TaxID=1802592 RepID=A0A1G1WAX5_9BACT|nr:MAG: hypothetical protein A2126_00815 [Candidatus Woykebacteria bacterium GWB1_45_5]